MFDIDDEEAWAIMIGDFELFDNVLDSYPCCALTSISVLLTALLILVLSNYKALGQGVL